MKSSLSISFLKQAIQQQLASSYQQLFHCLPCQEFYLDSPPQVSFGDFAVGCFPFARDLHKSPNEIAALLAGAVQSNDCIQTAQAVGPYINIKVPNTLLFSAVYEDALASNEKFGNSDIGQNARVMVEYLSPNTNKPLHLGHVRNGVLGMAVSNLLAATGHVVIKANLINDRGVHICKSMLAYQKWGGNSTPSSTNTKGDHFVGQMYVRYAQEEESLPEMEEEIQMLRLWEAGDSAIVALWEKMNEWVYSGFAETYRTLGLEFDVFYYESETYKLGKDIVVQGLRQGVFSQLENGLTITHVPEEVFRGGNKTKSKSKQQEPRTIALLRGDGTSMYMTQDIGTAVLKIEGYNLARSIYVVGSEQIDHFLSLFYILDRLGCSWAKNCFHLSYGMVYLPEGKMKSREGKVVDADDLVVEMSSLAEKEVRQRNPGLAEEGVKNRARALGLAAIKFFLLRQDPKMDIHFDPAESLSFDGATGPYCQYAYARAVSILRKAEGEDLSKSDFSLLGNAEELTLANRIIRFPDAISAASHCLNPATLCTRLYELAKDFSQFYQKHRVLGIECEELMAARLKLVQATAIALKRGLTLLGIEPLEEM